MEIYLVRHGDAEPAIFNTPEEDYERQLTESGEETLRYEALGLKNFVDSFDYILTSPYTRALQTAEIFADIFEYPDKIIKTLALKPPGNTEALLEEIESLEDAERVLCIGHTPSIGEIASEIVTSIQEEDFFDFRKGAILRLDMEYPALDLDAKLIYFLDPDILKFIGEILNNPSEEDDEEEETEETVPVETAIESGDKGKTKKKRAGKEEEF
jgi:phosphohistidine phosphatase